MLLFLGSPLMQNCLCISAIHQFCWSAFGREQELTHVVLLLLMLSVAFCCVVLLYMFCYYSLSLSPLGLFSIYLSVCITWHEILSLEKQNKVIV